MSLTELPATSCGVMDDGQWPLAVIILLGIYNSKICGYVGVMVCVILLRL